MKTLNRRDFPGAQYPERIIQFGEGNFLRAFVDWQIDLLNEHTDLNSGVVVVRPIETSFPPSLSTQDGLYTTIIRGLNEKGEAVSDARLIRSVNREISVYSEYDEFLKLAHNPEMRFVFSNTTEAGISYHAGDKFDDAPAVSYPAKLTRLLFERFSHFNGALDKGWIIIPCELIDYNGDALRELVLRYAQEWALPEAFIQWLDQANSFCSTLVDRIVTGYPRDEVAKLEEELIIRPTSETIIWNTYRNWIQSYRDLPILCNQWANVMRWEMRTRLFLRTAEFLWQEGHTAHATREEAEIEAKKMQGVYADFAENYMAMPVIKGVKSASERFAGALDTYTIEAMMQDGKALQAGTSHFLGQNFGKAFDVTFIDKNGKSDYAWATSWGVSTRLIGALIMSHSDDNGLVLPPHLAPIQVVIIPIYRSEEQLAQISEKVNGIVAKLKALGISVKFDNADNKKPGWKFAEYELKGVPVRLAMGGRDLENNTIEVMRRDTLEKETVTCDNIETYVQNLLEEIQKNIFQKALDHRTEKTITVDTYEEFKEKIEEGYFIMAHWDGTPETEEQVKNETKATIRCIPLEGDKTPGKCMVTGRPSAQRVLFARAY